MPSPRPETLPEWQEYINSLPVKALYSAAVAANSQTFARTLIREGQPLAHVEQIMRMFARQLRATGTRIPEGGPYDLVTMATLSRKVPVLSESDVQKLEWSKTVGSDDDLDRFEAAAD